MGLFNGRITGMTMKQQTYVTNLGAELINPHTADQCHGERCIIHSPTDHHMRGWDQVWAPDVSWAPGKVFRTIMRRCKHGEMHIDPDDGWAIKYLNITCECPCGCCAAPKAFFEPDDDSYPPDSDSWRDV